MRHMEHTAIHATQDRLQKLMRVPVEVDRHVDIAVHLDAVGGMIEIRGDSCKYTQATRRRTKPDKQKSGKNSS